MTARRRAAAAPAAAAHPPVELRLLDLATAAARLSVSIRTLKRAIALGQIHAVKLQIGVGKSGVWRIAEREIDRLIAEGMQAY